MRETGTRPGLPVAVLILCFVFGGCQGTAHVPSGTSPTRSSSSRQPVDYSRTKASRNETVPSDSDMTFTPELTHGKILNRDGTHECTWVQSHDVELGSEEDSPTFVNHRALAKAREYAMGTLLGIRVKSYKTMGSETLKGRTRQTFESYLRETQEAQIRLERIRYTHNGHGKCTYCPITQIILEDCLKQPQDRRFAVSLNMDHYQYNAGDEVKVTINTVAEKHIYLYDENLDTRKITLIAPDENLSDFKSRNGIRHFPTRDLSAEGVVLLAELPPGQKVSFEEILVIVTPTQLPLNIAKPKGTETEGDLLNRLDRMQIHWEIDSKPFSITTTASGSNDSLINTGPD